MNKGLGSLSFQERLRELSLCSLEKRHLKDTLMCSSMYRVSTKKKKTCFFLEVIWKRKGVMSNG